MSSNPSTESFKTALEKFHGLFFLFEEFKNILQQEEENSTSAYWMTFFDITQVLLDYAISICAGSWELHLAASERMLPGFMPMTAKITLAIFPTTGVGTSLFKDSHPSVYEAYIQGNFSTKRKVGKFNILLPDQVIEQTINK